MELDELRKKIDQADEEILRLLAKRMALIPGITDYKRKNSLPLRQPEREQELITRKKELAKELGLSQKFVEKLFRIIIEESLRLEEER